MLKRTDWRALREPAKDASYDDPQFELLPVRLTPA
jgi:hypothetical protein